ncbi:MAG: hypothetical protein AAFQ23_02255 [Cyanobacteria bacterium J06623_1]
MTIVKRTPRRVRRYRPNLWFEKLMALIAVVNLAIVAFDLSYVPLRDFWLSGQVTVGGINTAYVQLKGIEFDLIPEGASEFITQYDVVKGIVPNRNTEEYLAKIEELEQELALNGVASPNANALFGDIRRRSIEIIQTNPFAEAGKTGNLERIKNKMRSHIPNRDNSAKTAFWRYWTADYFTGKVAEEIAFFESEIKPLFKTNYYREIGENGG